MSVIRIFEHFGESVFIRSIITKLIGFYFGINTACNLVTKERNMKISDGCATNALYIGGADPIALFARLFGFEYKTATDEAHECASYLSQSTHEDHYVSVECNSINDLAPPVELFCYYKVLRSWDNIPD